MLAMDIVITPKPYLLTYGKHHMFNRVHTVNTIHPISESDMSTCLINNVGQMSLKEFNNDIFEIKDMIELLVKENEQLGMMEMDIYDELSRQALHEKRQILKSLKATLRKNIDNLRTFKMQ